MANFKVVDANQLPALIAEQTKQLALQSHQLLMLVGLKDVEIILLDGLLRVAVSSRLSEELLPLSNKRRANEVEELFNNLIANQTAGPLLLDRIQVLFEPSLQLDVLRCLKTASKYRPLIVNWPGDFDGKVLTFSRPGKPDYFNCSEAELNSVPVLWMTGHGEQQ